MLDTKDKLQIITFPKIQRGKLHTLQLNLGYKCNLQCLHCHVNASPKRTEMMTDKTLQSAKNFMLHQNIKILDLTGGAPELHPKFQNLVRWAFLHNIRVIDRCNLTILLEPGKETLADFLAKYKVEIIASMPCYLQENVDKQRGKGTFNKSIRALQILNKLGFGLPDTGLSLNLVFNPQDINLPPPQAQLALEYKKYLADNYQIIFNDLLVITNLPIARFGSMLLSKGEFKNYMQLLQEAYLAENKTSLMCKTLLSIDWQGNVYDCDFNQMLKLPTMSNEGSPINIKDLHSLLQLDQDIVVMGHCYGCTAGQGSSCGGALN